MFFIFLSIRSSYFQQIEEDVQKYTKQIIELRSAITNFKTNEMTELVKFHKDVESVLENLTDESQVSLETYMSIVPSIIVGSFISMHDIKFYCCVGAITV